MICPYAKIECRPECVNLYDCQRRSLFSLLDEMEAQRTINAPVMLATLRGALRCLEWYAAAHRPEEYLDDNGDQAEAELRSASRCLWAGWAAGVGGVGEHATTKDATDNDEMRDRPGSGGPQHQKGNE